MLGKGVDEKTDSKFSANVNEHCNDDKDLNYDDSVQANT